MNRMVKGPDPAWTSIRVTESAVMSSKASTSPRASRRSRETPVPRFRESQLGSREIPTPPRSPSDRLSAVMKREASSISSGFCPVGRKPEDIEEASLFITAESLSEGDRGGVGISREPNWLSLNLGTGVSLDLRLALGEAEALLDMTALSVTRMDVHAGSGPLTIRFMAGNPRNLGRLQFIAGSGPVRLEGLGWGRVVSLEFHGGSGEAFMDWNGPGPSEAAALLDAGAGGLDLKFPEELGVSVRGMGKILPSPPGRFHGDAEAWVSSNWETAERRLTLILDRGQSPVRVSWGR